MIPKASGHTAANLRPITLTDVSYKVFTTLTGQKIHQHITNNSRTKETKAVFTKGCRIEDNLFILQFCIELYKFH